MRILLDTSYLYSLMESYGRFPEDARTLIEETNADLYVSAASIWEMRLKHRALHPSGDRKSPHDPVDVLKMLEGHDVTFLPVKAHHAARDLNVPLAHKDPYDELLLVQAQEEGLKLLTEDKNLVGHPLAIAS